MKRLLRVSRNVLFYKLTKDECSFLHLLFFLFVVGMCTWMQVLWKSRIGHQAPWYGVISSVMWLTQDGWWELNSDPLQDQQVLLVAEPFLQLPDLMRIKATKRNESTEGGTWGAIPGSIWTLDSIDSTLLSELYSKCWFIFFLAKAILANLRNERIWQKKIAVRTQLLKDVFLWTSDTLTAQISSISGLYIYIFRHFPSLNITIIETNTWIMKPWCIKFPTL